MGLSLGGHDQGFDNALMGWRRQERGRGGEVVGQDAGATTCILITSSAEYQP